MRPFYQIERETYSTYFRPTRGFELGLTSDAFARATGWRRRCRLGAGGRDAWRGEQSTGTFTRVPGETDELRERHGAREMDAAAGPPGRAQVRRPRLPPRRGDFHGRFEHGAFASEPAGDGGGQPLGAETVLRPAPAGSCAAAAFLERYCGPQFGVAGTRRLCGVDGRPLIGTIVKPSVGLSPEATAGVVRAGRRRNRFHQGRRIAVRRTALPVRRTPGGGDARASAARRAHRKEGDVRRQYHRRNR